MDTVKLSLTKTFLVVCLFSGSAQLLHAQAAPTAVRRLAPSAFVMFSGVETGVATRGEASLAHGGHNLSVTAGGDLGVFTFSRYALAAEVRGTFPVNSGKIVGVEDILGGLRISREPTGIMGRGNTNWRPYADVLFGRNQMNFQSGGYFVSSGSSTLIYKQSAGTMFQAGGGVEYDFNPHFSIKVDAQAMLSQTPVVNTSSGAFGGQVSAGVSYRLGAR
jgi:hypothetical protein